MCEDAKRISDLEGTLRGVRATIPVIQRAAYERGAREFAEMLMGLWRNEPDGMGGRRDAAIYPGVTEHLTRFLGTRASEKGKGGA
jgi:hypothetical protein